MKGDGFWRLASRVRVLTSPILGLESAAERADEAADQLARVNALGFELILLGSSDESIVDKHAAHGTDFTTRAACDVVSLTFLRDMNAFPAFGNVVHHRNCRSLKLIAE